MDEQSCRWTGWEDMPAELRDKVFIQVAKALFDSRENARSVIIIAHGFIELLVNTLIEKKTKNGKKMANSRDFPHSAKLIILHELGLITDYRFQTLDYFRKLRNKASHEPLFKIDLIKLKSEFNQFVSDTPGIPNFRASTLHEFCLLLVITLWSDHSETFVPVFF